MITSIEVLDAWHKHGIGYRKIDFRMMLVLI